MMAAEHKKIVTISGAFGSEKLLSLLF